MLGILGVDIAALVAGLGLTGFALGFTLKDALSNLLAGILILFYQTPGFLKPWSLEVEPIVNCENYLA